MGLGAAFVQTAALVLLGCNGAGSSVVFCFARPNHFYGARLLPVAVEGPLADSPPLVGPGIFAGRLAGVASNGVGWRSHCRVCPGLRVHCPVVPLVPWRYLVGSLPGRAPLYNHRAKPAGLRRSISSRYSCREVTIFSWWATM